MAVPLPLHATLTPSLPLTVCEALSVWMYSTWSGWQGGQTAAVLLAVLAVSLGPAAVVESRAKRGFEEARALAGREGVGRGLQVVG